MTDENVIHEPTTGTAPDPHLAKRLDGAGWGLFLIWIGISLLADFEGGWTLLGIGVLILGMQVIRKALGLTMEGFWLVVGTLFTLSSIWQITGTEIPLLPVLLILAGAAILIKHGKEDLS